MIQKRVWSISQLLSYIKNKLTSDAYLTNVKVEGEIGNFKPNYSGHWYFSLKDNDSLIECAMFKNSNLRLGFLPKDGDKVVAIGNISVYEKSGKMQLVITSMELSGAGNFYIQFEKMRQKLEPLGYFDKSRKKSIPKYPETIVVVTGANTAALRDIQITTFKRWPLAKLLLCPTTVQGLEAPASISNALKYADSLNADVCILARGGGSVDDLWCFNDEGIAKTIFEMKTPIVTGIGHEIDTTIADLVSDERCATPTAAAQRVTPDKNEVNNDIDSILHTLKSTCQQKILNNEQTLDYFYTKLSSTDTLIEKQKRRIQLYDSMLSANASKKINLNHRLLNDLINNFKDSATVLNNNITERYQKLSNNLYVNTKQFVNESFMNYYNKVYCLEACKAELLNAARASKVSLNNLNHHNEVHLLNKLKMASNSFSNKVALLESVSPLNILTRDYSITSQDDKTIGSVDDVDFKKNISIRFKDGTILAKPLSKEK